jgi:hypothetical protein
MDEYPASFLLIGHQEDLASKPFYLVWSDPLKPLGVRIPLEFKDVFVVELENIIGGTPKNRYQIPQKGDLEEEMPD